MDEPNAPSRALCLAFTPLLPGLRTWRVVRRMRKKAGGPRQLVRSFVPLALGELSWAVGEGVGYASGRGAACECLR